ncbi:MAG TPA: DUF5063 domain-containing protein [Candidatus Sulfotelmatobacter sp.]|nr:DUF5063 domain-containing protein [Candidatus Sulfotelmatobacter sp.]
MKAQVNNTDVANRFAAAAQEFCSLVESAAELDRTGLLTEMYQVLPRLINEAILLPSIQSSKEDDAIEKQEQSLASPGARMTEEQWGQLYNLLKEKLGDWDLYWQVFDPTTDKEAVCGTLADDFADIYRDLKEGLILNEKHLARPEDLIWEWRLSYFSHWGKHAIDALLTIHFRLQGVLE